MSTSDAMKQVEGMRRLPLFPLPLVLVPNEVLPLHIFEERYRQMLKDVTARKGLFGINMLEGDQFAATRPEPGSVGCAAEVRDVNMLPDGRSNIVVFGVARYRLLEYVDSRKLYQIGRVEFFEDDPADDVALEILSESVFELFKRIAKAAHKLTGERGRFPEITRSDPESFSFQATASFIFDNSIKYELLTMTSTADRLEQLKDTLVRTVDQIELNADIREIARSNGHSKTPIDL